MCYTLIISFCRRLTFESFLCRNSDGIVERTDVASIGGRVHSQDTKPFARNFSNTDEVADVSHEVKPFQHSLVSILHRISTERL